MTHQCRFCQNKLNTIFADLNMAPLVNNYIAQGKNIHPEMTYPLIVYVCDACKLVQTIDFNSSNEIFTSDYAYFSSYSSSWLEHCKKYVDMICERLKLDKSSHIMEIASNDGYILQYFQEKGISHLGIEPCKSVADAAIAKGINTKIDFFTEDLAKELPQADLICMANVLAHVPNINDFIKGIVKALKINGTVTIEFPHVLNIIKYNQFDTIYHEHYSYLSLLFVDILLKKHALRVYDVEKISTHGGSLRVYACHEGSNIKKSHNVTVLLNEEILFGLNTMEIYSKYSEKVKATKRSLLSVLIEIKNQGKNIVAYGASAKGNTLFNYCGISTDFIAYSVDLNPHKQNTYLPGSRIPVFAPDKIRETKPDYILITPWNIQNEIIKQLDYIHEWGGKFIVAIPEAVIL